MVIFEEGNWKVRTLYSDDYAIEYYCETCGRLAMLGAQEIENKQIDWHAKIWKIPRTILEAYCLMRMGT